MSGIGHTIQTSGHTGQEHGVLIWSYVLFDVFGLVLFGLPLCYFQGESKFRTTKATARIDESYVFGRDVSDSCPLCRIHRLVVVGQKASSGSSLQK